MTVNFQLKYYLFKMTCIYIYVSLTLKTTDHFLHRPVAYADSVAQDQPSHPCSQTRELDCPLKSG